uniref:Uncharacterized protein n=1 Tax=Amphimedon queenslandica TaxID=400682 RepID=A0A1X7VH41_AMPQE
MAYPPAETAYDFLYKILLLGDTQVGKSSIIFQFVEKRFTSTFISTIGKVH